MKTKILVLAVLLVGGLLFTSSCTCEKDNALLEDIASAQFDVKDNYIEDQQLIHRISNSPDPFMNYTTISYNLPVAGFVELSVSHATLYKEIVLVREQKRAGMHSVGFNAAGMPSGDYSIVLRVNRELVATASAERVDNGSEFIFPDVN
ncbi:MAG: hypothetical protein DRI88_02100 [Bacteroidetes bacterium]|nr:MAG: hypothetical protein DRI88_02100 [Bacteroidota bacterium]RLD73551.1 MAG: hypothetical protein DRI87_03640 [Bacteroidota bacterium]RLD86718.1 MAG: hypothetical protein DRJ02_08135 [Bacteroidota bacterium]